MHDLWRPILEHEDHQDPRAKERLKRIIDAHEADEQLSPQDAGFLLIRMATLCAVDNALRTNGESILATSGE